MRRAIGLMSGTSLDGIDVALIESDGTAVRLPEAKMVEHDGFARPYTPDEQALLRQALKDATGITTRDERPGCLPEAEALITRAHAEAVEAFLAKRRTPASEIDLIGFHGQTVLHRPEAQLTVQIGDGAALARRLGIRVVSDLRAADVAAGGQGAPLVPIFHKALVESAGLAGPLAVLNVGGVANVTLIDAQGGLLAFDTGPGNAPINDWVEARTGKKYDKDGALAGSGRADGAVLDRLLQHPYFDRVPPKSLDRNAFDFSAVQHLNLNDGAATLTAFTAHAVHKALDHVAPGDRPNRWIVAGGGAKNLTLMGMLRDLLGVEIVNADALGWSADFLEAQAFAYLALRCDAELDITFPTTTGVKRAMSGGVPHAP